MELCDVTVREGGQMPGREYTADQKVAAGRALDSLGLQYVQPGFAATGERDREAIERLAATCDADVVSIARAVPADVEAALAAGADVVEVFGPLETRQLEHMVGSSREEMLDAMSEAVGAIEDGGATPRLTLVDAFRTEGVHLLDAFEQFPGVATVNLADTVGAVTPATVREYLGLLGDAGVDLSRAGVHFHDDMGVATANALLALDAGVGTADVSVASLGERAGNTALEELVAAGVTDLDVDFGLDHSELVPVCREVLEVLGEGVDRRKAVLGEEVSQHESSIHVAAMLSDPSVMEPFDPGRFGGERVLLFGERTGRTGAARLLERAGRDPTAERISALLETLADQGPLGLDAALDRARSV